MVWSTKNSRLVASGLLSGVAVGLFGCFIFLVEQWARSAPVTPDGHLGLVYPHNEHGSVTYFSALQTTACALMFWAAPMVFIVGFGLVPKKNVKTRSVPLAWSMRFDVDGSMRLLTISQLAGVGIAIVGIAGLGDPLVTWLVEHGVVLRFG
jgi:hypothetical protein